MCLSFDETRGFLPRGVQSQTTGNPIRREIAQLSAEIGMSDQSTRRTLLVLGGSQGAAGVNQAVVAHWNDNSRISHVVIHAPNRGNAL